MDAISIDLIRSADLIIRRLLAVKPGEQVAIVCDPLSEMSMAFALAGMVESVGGEYTLMLMPTRQTDRKNDLTPVIEKGLEAADCLIGLTGASGAPTYSSAVKALYRAGKIRTISMVMRKLDNFISGGALADYDALLEEGNKLAAIWKTANTIHITSPAGTDLYAPISGEQVIIECGFATEPGQEAAFSDGEVSQMPQVNKAEGLIVVDGPIAHIGAVDRPIFLQVEKGRVISIQGDCRQADELRLILETTNNAANIAEIGIGLNPMCRQNGDFEEEKKGRGNVHIALGDNVFYGGDVHSPVHMDMVLYRPTVKLDDGLVVENGEISI
ncbi:MAG: aminopeptidase [Anaerolineales bacterium]|nr:aminopeptidase [Anaerolineales bacterium]